jgi:hypothetical protein
MQKGNKSKFFSSRNLMVWFFIIIMSFSIGGLFFFGGPQTAETARYGNFNFYKQGNFWMTKINGKALPFTYLPNELGSINVSEGLKDKLTGKYSLYITFDPSQGNLAETDLARFELRDDLANFYNAYATEGVTSASGSYMLPVVTCENATPFSPVIVLTQANQTQAGEGSDGSITIDGDCILVQGQGGSLLKLKDRIMYSLAGIMG